MLKLAWYSFLEQLKKSIRPVKLLYLIPIYITILEISDYSKETGSTTIYMLWFLSYLIDDPKQYGRIFYLIPRNKRFLQGYMVWWSYFVYFFYLMLLVPFVIIMATTKPEMLNKKTVVELLLIIAMFSIHSIAKVTFAQVDRHSKWERIEITVAISSYIGAMITWFCKEYDYACVMLIVALILFEVYRFLSVKSTWFQDYENDCKTLVREKKQDIMDAMLTDN
ncbi:hypothetical protein lbkm_4241 [Lachnospiraceae bacterium KM106-2]|nr:hypothetical protein lbkm_4241 [Lachnospiraceae bacterium KM106-2]